jgi:hypothetical protein
MLPSSRPNRANYLAFFLAVAFLALGVWRLVTNDTGFGVLYLAFAAAWVLIGFLWRRRFRS